MPTEIYKLINELANFLFTNDELKNTTAAKLDPAKVNFICAYTRERSGQFITPSQVNQRLNKKIQNLRRSNAEQAEGRAKKIRKLTVDLVPKIIIEENIECTQTDDNVNQTIDASNCCNN